MKIITDDACYVQKNDMIYLNRSDMAIPASIFMEFWGKGIVIIDDSNRYEFVKFTDPLDIEFFRGIDWIVDYYDVKDLSNEDIIEVANEINEEKKKIAEVYNTMSDKDKEANYDMVVRAELLDYKFYSLRDFCWFRGGHIKFSLPDGVEYPADFATGTTIDSTSVQKNIDENVLQESSEIVSDKKSKKGIKQFIKSIFSK